MKPVTHRTRRVVIKARIVKLSRGGVQSMRAHLRYIAREGVTPEGERGQAYSKDTDVADTREFAERCEEDRHQFRFIVSPEDAHELADLNAFTRQVMGQMEQDLETPLDWVAVNHWDTDNPHVHIVLRGKDAAHQDLVIDRDYMSQGMRSRASEVATEWLGLKSDRDIAASLHREVVAERWTALDASLLERQQDGLVSIKGLGQADLRMRSALLGRLATLERLGLATRESAQAWRLEPNLEPTLRALGERGDIVKAMHRALNGQQRELAWPGSAHAAVVEGKVIGRGFVDELHDRGYLIVDGIDARAHYVALDPHARVQDFPRGSLVQVRFTPEPRAADRRIAAMAADGLYRTEIHRRSLEGNRTTEEVRAILEAHTRRLEALRRAGVVERVGEGIWQVPSDVIVRGRAYDQSQQQHPTVALRSTLTVKQQQRAIGATWLDDQLASGAAPAAAGFGAEVRTALRNREAFLVETGLARREANGLKFARDFRQQLRQRELQSIGTRLAAESGLTYRAITDGTAASGTYRRSLQLVSGRFAMLDDGVGFSLVPWRPVIGKRLGQSMTAISRGEHVSWYFGRTRGLER